MSDTANPLVWKLRRVAAGFRQQGIASLVGISTSRYSAIERCEVSPSELDRALVERTLPRLPTQILANEKYVRESQVRSRGRKETPESGYLD